jgi:phage antirepressor YoqD-like protein
MNMSNTADNILPRAYVFRQGRALRLTMKYMERSIFSLKTEDTEKPNKFTVKIMVITSNILRNIISLKNLAQNHPNKVWLSG